MYWTGYDKGLADLARAFLAIVAIAVPSAIGCIIGIALLAFGWFWAGLAAASIGVTAGIVLALHLARLW